MAAAHDSVPICIGVAGKGDVESLPESDHSRHRIHRRSIHADLTIPVDAHEAEGRIDEVIHDLEVESVAVPDGIPVGYAGAAQRIHPDTNLALANGLEIDDRLEISHVGLEVRMGMRGGRPPSPIKRDSHYP